MNAIKIILMISLLFSGFTVSAQGLIRTILLDNERSSFFNDYHFSRDMIDKYHIRKIILSRQEYSGTFEEMEGKIYCELAFGREGVEIYKKLTTFPGTVITRYIEYYENGSPRQLIQNFNGEEKVITESYTDNSIHIRWVLSKGKRTIDSEERNETFVKDSTGIITKFMERGGGQGKGFKIFRSDSAINISYFMLDVNNRDSVYRTGSIKSYFNADSTVQYVFCNDGEYAGKYTLDCLGGSFTERHFNGQHKLLYELGEGTLLIYNADGFVSEARYTRTDRLVYKVYFYLNGLPAYSVWYKENGHPDHKLNFSYGFY
jgi:hypothetical protein